MSYLLGTGGGRGRNPGPGRRPPRLPPSPFQAAPGLVFLSWDLGARVGQAEGLERSARSPARERVAGSRGRPAPAGFRARPGGGGGGEEEWEEGAQRGRRRGGVELRKRPERLPLAGGHADPQDASPSGRAVPCSGGGDRSAWRVSGFLAAPQAPKSTPRKHML